MGPDLGRSHSFDHQVAPLVFFCRQPKLGVTRAVGQAGSSLPPRQAQLARVLSKTGVVWILRPPLLPFYSISVDPNLAAPVRAGETTLLIHTLHPEVCSPSGLSSSPCKGFWDPSVPAQRSHPSHPHSPGAPARPTPPLSWSAPRALAACLWLPVSGIFCLQVSVCLSLSPTLPTRSHLIVQCVCSGRFPGPTPAEHQVSRHAWGPGTFILYEFH